MPDLPFRLLPKLLFPPLLQPYSQKSLNKSALYDLWKISQSHTILPRPRRIKRLPYSCYSRFRSLLSSHLCGMTRLYTIATSFPLRWVGILGPETPDKSRIAAAAVSTEIQEHKSLSSASAVKLAVAGPNEPSSESHPTRSRFPIWYPLQFIQCAKCGIFPPDTRRH